MMSVSELRYSTRRVVKKMSQNCKQHFFSKKYGGRGASGRRGDRPTTCTVLEASQERVRYASAPGCPGHGRASLALTDLHTHHRQRRSAGTLKCTVLYTYDELPPRATGDLRGIHKRTRLRRRIDAGGPLAGHLGRLAIVKSTLIEVDHASTGGFT